MSHPYFNVTSTLPHTNISNNPMTFNYNFNAQHVEMLPVKQHTATPDDVIVRSKVCALVSAHREHNNPTFIPICTGVVFLFKKWILTRLRP